jgi:anti-sigma factor RsiW
VSILSRLAANRHLDDDALAEIWTAAQSAEASTDGRIATHPHLTACAHCRARYAAFSSWLEEIRASAHTEADEAFPPERLAAQQAQIFRRLEALERPARIIAFPKFSRPVKGSRRLVPRWVPTAVAAGLVVGLATGQFLDFAHVDDQPRNATGERATADSTPPPRPGAVQPASLSSDEALFYGDAEWEFAARSARYMPTLDELTPRARDEFDRSR